MKIVYAEEFYKKFKKLPAETKDNYKKQEAIFKQPHAFFFSDHPELPGAFCFC